MSRSSGPTRPKVNRDDVKTAGYGITGSQCHYIYIYIISMILIRNSISILSMPVCFLSYSRLFTCWIWMDMVKFAAQRSIGYFTHILTSFQGFWRFDNLRHLFLPGFLAPVGLQNLQSVTLFTSNPPNLGIKKTDTLFQSDVFLVLSAGVNPISTFFIVEPLEKPSRLRQNRGVVWKHPIRHPLYINGCFMGASPIDFLRGSHKPIPTLITPFLCKKTHILICKTVTSSCGISYTYIYIYIHIIYIYIQKRVPSIYIYTHSIFEMILIQFIISSVLGSEIRHSWRISHTPVISHGSKNKQFSTANS